MKKFNNLIGSGGFSKLSPAFGLNVEEVRVIKSETGSFSVWEFSAFNWLTSGYETAGCSILPTSGQQSKEVQYFPFPKAAGCLYLWCPAEGSDGTTGSGHGSISVDISESLQVDLFCLSGDGGGAQYGHSRHGISQWAEAQGFDARRKHGG